MQLREKFVRWCSRLYVDVHPWIKASHAKGSPAYGGIFHYARLFMRYGAHPFILGDEFKDYCIDNLTCQPALLKKAVAPRLIERKCEGDYLALGLDQVCQHVKFYVANKKYVLVHDNFALDGDFGDTNRATAARIENNPEFIKLDINSPANMFLYTGVYPGFFAEADFTMPVYFRRELISIMNNNRLGKHISMAEMIARAVSFNEPICLIGSTPRTENAAFYLDMSLIFVNVSTREGFSLTPYEAVMHGVPTIILSNIAAHRGFKAYCEQTGCTNKIILIDVHDLNFYEKLQQPMFIRGLTTKECPELFKLGLMPWHALATFLDGLKDV